MNLYLLTFFFIQYPLSFANNISCDLFKAINEIVVAKTNKKYMFFFQWFYAIPFQKLETVLTLMIKRAKGIKIDEAFFYNTFEHILFKYVFGQVKN
jgi:hypothetical protein